MAGVLKRLLVATDGSPNSERAIAFAIAVARKRQSEIVLCCAVDRAAAVAQSSMSVGGFAIGLPIVTVLDEAAAETLASAGSHIERAGIVGTTHLLDGRPADAIAACANDRHVDAIVIGTQGKRGLERFFLGSTAEGILRQTHVPTFVIPPRVVALEADFERIVVAVDDSDPSDAAAAVAIDIARTENAKLTFCTAVDVTELLERASADGYDLTTSFEDLRERGRALVATHTERARERGVQAEGTVLDGAPRETILTIAATQSAGLIVVGTHGRRGVQRFFLGSIAETIVRESSVPVLVVRATR